MYSKFQRRKPVKLNFRQIGDFKIPHFTTSISPGSPEKQISLECV